VPDFDAITPESLAAAGHLKWTKYGPGKLGAFVAEMDYGTAPEVTAALHDAVDRGQFGYLPPGVTAAMGEACAAWQADTYGWAIEPADVIPLPDVIHGMRVAIDHFSRPGSPVILPLPAYMPFLDVPALHGRETLFVEMVRDGDRYVYDLDALDRAFAAGGHLLILCNPCNPLGRVMDAAELDAIAAVVERHGGRVFADEIHAPLVYAGHRHVPYASRSATTAAHTVTATSASKAWNLPGLKCAQLIVSNDADRGVLESLGPWANLGTSTLGAVANTAAFARGRPWLDAVLAYLDRNRHLLAELLDALLPDVRYTPPEGTYLAWLDCRDLGLPSALDDFFLEHAGVALVDGARCGPPGQGFVRLNIATTAAILTRVVEQMAAAVRSYGS
jgi:cysteine-S-conjugate beta-lyase